MEFGNQEFFDRLKAGVTAGDQDVYVELNNVVSRSVRNLVRAKVKPQDVDDVLQNIQVSVWRHLTPFLQSSENNTPAQRNAWLIVLAKSRINDFLNANYKNRPQQFDEGESSGKGTGNPGPTPPFPVDPVQLANYELCCRAISYVCRLNMTPDRLLSCIYNGLVIPAAFKGHARKKGNPKLVVHLFAGRPLSQFRAALWQALNTLLILPPPEDLLAPLDQKLQGGAGDEPFQLTAREITVVTNRMRKALQKDRDKILGGTLDE